MACLVTVVLPLGCRERQPQAAASAAADALPAPADSAPDAAELPAPSGPAPRSSAPARAFGRSHKAESVQTCGVDLTCRHEFCRRRCKKAPFVSASTETDGNRRTGLYLACVAECAAATDAAP
ncbi:MAG: hypothetical protein R3B13_25685 [Polyangiaceae bacterium]